MSSQRVLKQEPALARQVLAYFLAHPDRSYAMQHLAQSCLPEQFIYAIVGHVEEALRWLVQRGFLLEHRSRAAETVFSLKEARRAAAERFAVARTGSQPAPVATSGRTEGGA